MHLCRLRISGHSIERLGHACSAKQTTLLSNPIRGRVHLFLQARATHGAYEGTWYYEVTIARLGPTGHSRVGWATARAEIQAPVRFCSAGCNHERIPSCFRSSSISSSSVCLFQHPFWVSGGGGASTRLRCPCGCNSSQKYDSAASSLNL